MRSPCRTALTTASALGIALTLSPWLFAGPPAVAAEPVSTLVGRCEPLVLESLEDGGIDIPIAYGGSSPTRSVVIDLEWEASTNEEIIIARNAWEKLGHARPAGKF